MRNTTAYLQKHILFTGCLVLNLIFQPGWVKNGLSQSAFQKYYDRDFGVSNSIGEVGHAVIQTGDGGFLAVGYSDGYGIGMKDIYAVRLNSDGDTLWTKLYGNSTGNDMARSVIQTGDGGFAIAAETQSGAGAIDAAILKIDSSGNLVWSKAFGGNKDELGHSIIEMSDQSLILAGEALTFSATGYSEIFLVKVSGNGSLLWAKTFNGGGGELARSIANTSDGGFIIAGDENSFGYGPCMIKFNSNGDTSWCRTYRAAYSSYEGHFAGQTADGGYIMAANTFGGTIGGSDLIALKVTSSGTISWTSDIGTINYDYASDIIQTGDGGYVISGTAMPGGTYYDMVIAKLNSSGVLQWSKDFSGNYGTTWATDARFQVSETSDHGLISIGSVYNNFFDTISYNGYDMMIVKTDSAGGGLPAGCVKNANLQSASVTWDTYMAPFILANVSPTVTNSVFVQKNTNGNYGDAAVRINFTNTPVSCGSCDGTSAASTCNPVYTSMCSGANPYAYSWSNNQTASTATDLCSGTYNLTITDYVGCTGIGTASISSAASPQEICLVTVDSTSSKNIIVWEKPVTTGIDSFRVYREIGLGNYVLIGSVAYSAASEFTDNTFGINPNIQSYRYKLSVIDTCGNESALSAHHRTIHLATPQFTPPNKTDLIWTNDYEGFSFPLYYILRDGYNTGNWVKVDSVTYGNNSWTDLFAPSDSARYIVEAKHPGGCTAGKMIKNYNASKSNTATTSIGPGFDELIENRKGEVTVIPNPFSETAALLIEGVQMDPKRISAVRLTILDVFGKKVGELVLPEGEINLQLHRGNFPEGFYFFELSGANGIIGRGKFAIE